ncbi:hypothetical protein PFLUV_G00026470 [Perca fluviatilis]|uniref:Uncharacterized protein n=1 Tax=Perca fluviatilis TaxID=8168 RepID=A0A6A5EZ03_PERFL|nr:hypothetical protein PFLUV_G00026470 [Perca fluviatilis]
MAFVVLVAVERSQQPGCGSSLKASLRLLFPTSRAAPSQHQRCSICCNVTGEQGFVPVGHNKGPCELDLLL